MSRPGTDVVLLDTPSSVSIPTDTGTGFAAGLADRGPSDATLLIQSLSEFVTKYGARQTYSVLYDAVDLFFREGGNRLYIGRVVGPAATIGGINLSDGVGTSLVVKAKGPGAWSANYKVQVTAGSVGGTYRIKVLDLANVVLEDSGDLVDQNSAVLWSANSSYINITLGATALNPAVAAATAMSAGTDDRASITDAQWLAALNLFTRDLGPGQVFAPGRTSTTGHSQLTAHAEANRRVALLDAPDTPTQATLLAAAGAQNSRMGAMFWPWVVIPGVVSGTTRSVPPSAFVAGKLAKNDPALGTNRAAAGNAGRASYVTGLTQPGVDDTVRASYNGVGLNVIRSVFGGIRTYGWRTLTDPISDANWLNFGNSRLFMELGAEFDEVAENYAFETIDGQNGVAVNGLHDALTGICKQHFDDGELFGDDPSQAYFVDTSPSVNTLTTIQNLELHAVVNLRMATMAEWVQIYVVKRQVTDVLA